MPISESLAREKLRRFSGYIPLPAPEDMRRITQAFMGIASDPDHAERMTGAMEKSLHYFPKIVDLSESSEATMPNPQIKDFKGLGYRCGLCQDTGYTSEERGGISFATRCACIPPAEPETDKARTGRQA